MALIKSISGIRGTIGGAPEDNFTPPDIVKFAAAYGMWLKAAGTKKSGQKKKSQVCDKKKRQKKKVTPGGKS